MPKTSEKPFSIFQRQVYVIKNLQTSRLAFAGRLA